MYTEQAPLPDEVCRCNILSINRVHKVYGHFLPSVLDKNSLMDFLACLTASRMKRGPPWRHSCTILHKISTSAHWWRLSHLQEPVFPIFTEHLLQCRRICPGLTHNPHIQYGLLRSAPSLTPLLPQQIGRLGRNNSWQCSEMAFFRLQMNLGIRSVRRLNWRRGWDSNSR